MNTRPILTPRPAATGATMVLRATLLVDGGVFLLAALLNLGARIPLGFTELSFPVPIWQAGIGEAAIGVILILAAVTRRGTLAWLAFWLSVAGIAFGLRSSQVQGPAREIHVLLVPLALVVFGLLVWRRRELRSRRSEPSDKTPKALR
jgi:hypothetical protein